MTRRAAIIGLGIMGRRMLEHMGRHEGFAPVALWDPSPEATAAAAKVAAEHAPDARPVADAAAAIAAADVVYLACPPVPRKALALEAAATGKAVFLEKPLGVDRAESEALVAGLAEAGVPAAVNFTQAAGAPLARIRADAESGAMGELIGVDIVVTYPRWPRAWQAAADWLRFREEGGWTREVISHFLFFSERVLGPLSVDHSVPTFPADPALCETHLSARLLSADGRAVQILGSVGGAQPDRQELTVKGAARSHRVTDFYVHAASDGGAWTDMDPPGTDPRAPALRAQLDALAECMAGRPHALATPEEALRVQILVETMLAGRAPG